VVPAAEGGILLLDEALVADARALDVIKERRPDLPVIMVTTYGDDERRRRASEYGAAEFMTKPIDFEFLKAQLRRLSLRCERSCGNESRRCRSL
jgi:DNA-binding NtrC family response regulator